MDLVLEELELTVGVVEALEEKVLVLVVEVQQVQIVYLVQEHP